MIRLTKKILHLLDRDEKARFHRLFLLVVLTSFLEVIGISSVMPFLALVADPAALTRSEALQTVMHAISPDEPRRFTIMLGVAALALLLVSNFVLALVNWRLMLFTYGLGHTLSARLLRRYLFRSYEAFLAANAADARKNVLDETVQIVNAATVPFMQALARIPVVVLIMAMVVIADPLLSPLIIAVLGGLYLLVYGGLRRWLRAIGEARLAANLRRFRVAHEAIDALVEIKLLGKENHYQRLYDESSGKFAETQALSMTLAMTPRYVLEALAFGGILLILVYLLATRDSLGSALPLVTLYAVAGYRMMPALQLIFAGFTKARFSEPSLDLLAEEIARPSPTTAAAAATDPARYRDFESLAFENVGFTFAGQSRPTLRDISLRIRARTVLGIAGPTGSGKTTVVHLLMGLLQPTQGRILIDGEPLKSADAPDWQRIIGYVPQQVYLADATIRENIALGEAPDEIDDGRVTAAAQLANLHDFILTLPQHYSTTIGDRGARLSGGQRQRLAIARALYNDANLLIFDEATSALDTPTEEAVMEAINRLASKKTVVVIAHRLHTLQQADEILVVRDGAVVAQGTYAELTRLRLLPTASGVA